MRHMKVMGVFGVVVFFCKQKTAYEMRISDWSSDVCSSDLVVVAGGAESMSNVEYYSTAVRKGARFGSIEMHDRLTRARLMSQPIERYGVISGMIETAENVARDFGITREQSDAYAVRSHQRAAAAWREGRFDAEVGSDEPTSELQSLMR